MSDSLFSLYSLAIAIPVVALATYAIVLNLDRITQVLIPLQPTSPEPPTFPKQSFTSRQSLKMQRDQSTIYTERGKANEITRIPGKSGERPTRWKVLQSLLGKMFFPLWNVLVIISAFFWHILVSCKKRQRQRRGNESLPTLMGNLGDVEVQVQVDVNVEKGWASTAGSPL
jgi:hypothetical protein